MVQLELNSRERAGRVSSSSCCIESSIAVVIISIPSTSILLVASVARPPKTQQKTKEQKMAAAMAGGRNKGKKKWSKGKVREKVANKVLYDQEAYERLLIEVPKMKLISASAVVERLKVTASLARASIRELTEKGLIQKVLSHHAQLIYTRASAQEE